MSEITQNHPVARAWRVGLEVEAKRQSETHRLLAGVQTVAFHVAGFGLAVEVRALPAGSIEPQWLRTGDGDLLTPNGLRIWNRLMTLAIEVAEAVGAPGDAAAVLLTPAAHAAARAALPDEGEKREAA